MIIMRTEQRNENTDNKLTEHDETIGQIIRALNNLIEAPSKQKGKIGFNPD
jgi:hypothetical protein